MADCAGETLAGAPHARARMLRALGGLLLVPLFIAVMALSTGCTPAQEPAEPVETIRIGAFKGEEAALVWLAESEGLFSRHGLQAQLTGFESDLASVGALMAGAEDVATGSDAVFVSKSLAPDSKGDLRILAEIAHSEAIEIVVRQDRGIAAPADLKNRRIALTGQTPAAYFLDRYLHYQHLDPQSVAIVDLTPMAIVDAVVAGSVDGAVAWKSVIWKIKQQLGANARSWPVQSGQHYDFLLICTKDFAEKRPRAAQRLLRALADAETLLRTDPARARLALARKLGSDEPHLVEALPELDITLSLGQGLLVGMESQARWRMDKGLAIKRPTPNFLKNLLPGFLYSVTPDAVTVYR